MRDAGIADPESAAGILFCAGGRNTESRCPYPECVVFETNTRQRALRSTMAKELRMQGKTVAEIAETMGVQPSTVYTYFRR